MMGEAETQEGNEEQKKPNMPDKEKIEKKLPTEEEDIDKNPDIEDPRLYSPLQEPDRPAPSERVTDEGECVEKTESDES